MHWSKTRHCDYVACPRRFFYTNIAAPQNPDIAALRDVRGKAIVRHDIVRSLLNKLAKSDVEAILDPGILIEQARETLSRSLKDDLAVSSEMSIIEVCIHRYIEYMHDYVVDHNVLYHPVGEPTEFMYGSLSINCQPELVLERDDDVQILSWRTGESRYRKDDESKLKAFALTCWTRKVLGVLDKPVTVTDVYLREDCAAFDCVLDDDGFQAYMDLAQKTSSEYSSSAKIRDFSSIPSVSGCRFCGYRSICDDWHKFSESDFDVSALSAAAAVASESVDDVMQGATTKDVFLSHVSEDKEAIVRPFARALGAEGISFWLDEAEIRLGDSLTKKMNEGLRDSRYLVCFLSRAFVDRGWTVAEVGAALTNEISGGSQQVLPIIVRDKEDILNEYPLFRDKKYIEWTDGIPAILRELKRVLA